MQPNLVKADVIRFLLAVAIAIMVSIALSFTLWSTAEAQQNTADGSTGRFFAGAALGLQTDTPDGTAYALGLYGDYYLTRRFSIGPLLQIGLTGDLFQVGLTGQAKYTLGIAGFPELKPHVQAGIGFIYADLDRKGSKREDDTSFLMPFGAGAEYQLTDAVSLDASVLFNITNLDVRDENFFITWLIGLRFAF